KLREGFTLRAKNVEETEALTPALRTHLEMRERIESPLGGRLNEAEREQSRPLRAVILSADTPADADRIGRSITALGVPAPDTIAGTARGSGEVDEKRPLIFGCGIPLLSLPPSEVAADGGASLLYARPRHTEEPRAFSDLLS